LEITFSDDALNYRAVQSGSVPDGLLGLVMKHVSFEHEWNVYLAEKKGLMLIVDHENHLNGFECVAGSQNAQ